MFGKILFIALINILFNASICFASITVEWGYTPPSSPAVIGFNLYKFGKIVDQFKGSTITSGISNVSVTSGDSFTLTAVFNDGTESSMSSPFIYKGSSNILSIPIIKSIILD